MSIETQGAQSPAVSRQDFINRIPQYEINPLFLRPHLNRETVGGTVGDRGGGKSASDAVIGTVDHLLSGRPVWSNMKIKCDIEVPDDTARKYGLNYGGIAHYESQKLDKDALLALDEKYMNSCILIEEINVEYSNVRRFNTNTNIDFNEVCQQLRKFKTSLLYNVIDEMFIDVQLRALSDFMIKTYDTAFDLDSLEAEKEPGIDFKWLVYPLTGYLAGEQGRYIYTKKPMPSIFFHFGPWRGIYDSTKYQRAGIYSMSTKDKKKRLEAEITATSSPELVQEVNRWAWLEEAAQQLREEGRKEIEDWELWQYLDIAGRGLTTNGVGQHLKAYGIRKRNKTARDTGYIINDFKLGANTKRGSFGVSIVYK